jgi:valyl-tRNA synthetase
VLDRTLRLAHPIIPHITEELWSYLPGERGLLLRAAWPVAGETPRDEGAERAVAAAFEVVVELRRLRNDADLPRSERLTLAIDGGETAASLRRAGDVLAGLANVELDGAGQGQGGFPIAIGDATVRVLGDRLSASLRGNVERRLGAARGELERARQKLANERFVSRARPELVDAEREKEGRFAREVAELEQRLAAL